MADTLRAVDGPIGDTATHLLRSLLKSFGELFLAHDDGRGRAVLDLLKEPDGDVAKRTLQMFTHGMGGLMDVPLCRAGVARQIGQPAEVDVAATNERDRLADEVWTAARAAIGGQDL